jgi:hypothetical protein
MLTDPEIWSTLAARHLLNICFNLKLANVLAVALGVHDLTLLGDLGDRYGK